MYFFGAFDRSQVAINNGTVTQTMVREFSEDYLHNDATHTPPHPQRDFTTGQFVQPHQPPQGPWPTAADGPAQSNSLESFCLSCLLPMLDDLQRRIPELGLSGKAQESLARTTADLRRTLRATPIDMHAVTEGLAHIRAVLSASEQNAASPLDDLRHVPQRGGAL